MTFSIDDFGATAPVKHCDYCPRCLACGITFRYLCEMYHHLRPVSNMTQHRYITPTGGAAPEHYCGKCAICETWSTAKFAGPRGWRVVNR